MEPWELHAREAIRDSIAQYNHAGDRFFLEELAAAFCEDGVLEVAGRDPAVGRSAIITLLGGDPTKSADELREAAKAKNAATGERRIVRHNIANIRFESVTPTEARVSCYFTVLTQIGLDHYGRYRDVFVPVDTRWLIKHRRVTVDWRAEGATFASTFFKR